ncbi:MAG: MoxR family ATPase [Chitinophagales bacterium]|nr:MoxR family ATPase [Bacteroidota bacterium]MCB9043604.1 MoxR family ATPase [Chitinophagales bacterium]
MDSSFQQPTFDIVQLNELIQQESAVVETLRAEIGKTVIGQDYMISRLLVALFSNGHILLEGVPGLAKTLAIKTLSQAVAAKFSRIQFTPDLLPADLIGTMVYNPKEHNFSVKKGPVFANFVLADEINRAPAKVQSALLEAMQEHQVTIGEESFALPEPFLVLATQNPLEQEGTYPLPEAQLDRFMLKAVISYPSQEDEIRIMRQNVQQSQSKPQAVISPQQLLQIRKAVKSVYMDEKIERYILDIVFASRYPEKYALKKLTDLISYGGSPRASINLALAAKAYAFLQKRAYVIPEDVRAISKDVLRHRIGVTYEAEAENITSDKIIAEILNGVIVP